MITGVDLSPPGKTLDYYRAYQVGFSIPTAHRFSSNVANSRSRAFPEPVFIQGKVLTNKHSVRLEPTKLILLIVGTRNTYQATGDAGSLMSKYYTRSAFR